jgi:hypothetical protein
MSELKARTEPVIRRLVHLNTDRTVAVQNLLLTGRLVLALNPDSVGRSGAEGNWELVSNDGEPNKAYYYLSKVTDREAVDELVNEVLKTLAPEVKQPTGFWSKLFG